MPEHKRIQALNSKKQKEMKPVIRAITAGICGIVLIASVSCDVVDSNKEEWGFAKVYMPQAVVQSGGTDNNYHVPSGTSEFDKNYTIEKAGGSDNIKVILGVYRSGLQELEGYSVDVSARPDTVQQLISSGVLAEVMLLPADTYSLPANITVPDGEREATFDLVIDRNKLRSSYADYVGKRLALAVAISNPSRYELNRSLSTTIVIIESGWDTLE